MVLFGMCNVFEMVNCMLLVWCVVLISSCVVIYGDNVDFVVIFGGVFIEVIWNISLLLIY